jgi:drug/metabolite transporter (DMT)-like permease
MIKTEKSHTYLIGGIIICLLGSICFSTKAVLVKLAYRDTPVDAVTLLALRMFFSLPFFVISALFVSKKQDNVKFTSRQWVSVAIIGCLGYYVSSLFDFVGLKYVTAGMERLILFVYPTLVLLMSSLILKEKIKNIQWIAVAISYAGLLLAFVNEVGVQAEKSEHFFTGALFIFACAFTYATYIVGSGRLIPVVGAAKFNSYAMSFACLGVITHFFITSDRSLFHLPTQVYFYTLLMAVFSTVLPSYLVSEGIKRIGSDNAAIIASVGPVSTILQAYLFLSEPISFIQIIGTVLILVGVLLISLRKEKPTVPVNQD